MKKTYTIVLVLIFFTLLIPSISISSLSLPEEHDEIICRVFITYEKNNIKNPVGKFASGDCWATFSIWPNPPISYVINPNNDEGFTETQVKTTLVTASETWDIETNKELFNNNPTINKKAKIGIRDGKNVIGFGRLGTGTIAVTYLWGSSAAIVEWDMKFNSRLIWGDATQDPNVFDFQAIACHEFGHTFGMDDIYETSCSGVTMYGYGDTGDYQQRTLEAPDIEGLHYLYGP